MLNFRQVLQLFQILNYILSFKRNNSSVLQGVKKLKFAYLCMYKLFKIASFI